MAQQRHSHGIPIALVVLIALVAGTLPLVFPIGPERLGVDGVTAATRPGQSVVGSVTSDYELLDEPRPRDAALKPDAVLTLVRWSNNLSYGLGPVSSPGTQAILLLPTVRPEATTDVRVLGAVIRLCADVYRDPQLTIAIPAGSQVPASYARLAKAPGEGVSVRIVELSDAPSRSLPSPTALAGATCDLPEPVVMTDAVILVPALWRDEDGGVHGALDAVAALAGEGAPSDSARVDLVSAVGPLYAFADALRPRVGDEAEAANAILASTDPCALDAVASQLLGATPGDVPGLALAAQTGVGQIAWADIKLNGAAVPGVPQEETPFEGPAGAPTGRMNR